MTTPFRFLIAAAASAGNGDPRIHAGVISVEILQIRQIETVPGGSTVATPMSPAEIPLTLNRQSLPL